MGNLKPVFGIFAVVGWLVLLGLHVVWRFSFGWLFTTLADLLDAVSISGLGIHIKPFGSVSAWLRSLDRNVDYAFVHAANNLEHTAVWLFSRVGHVLGWIGNQIAAVALGAEHAIRKLIRVTIPRLVHRLLRALWSEVRRIVNYARKMIPKLLKQITRFAKWAKHEIAKGARHLGFLWKWAKAVLKYHWKIIRGALKRLHALERKLTPKGFRKLLIGALGPLGWLWLVTDGMLHFAKWMARQPLGAIVEWVTDEVEGLALADMCDMADFVVDVNEYVFEPILRDLIGLTNLLCKPTKHRVPSGVPYPVTYALGWTPSASPALGDIERLAPGIPLPRGVVKA